MRIGILGGTGPAGRSLAARLASVGHEPVIGSRSAERAAEVRDELVAQWPGRELNIGAEDNAGAASCEVVVVATPWDGAEDTVRELKAELEGKVVISMANALARLGKVFQPLTLPRGSVAVSIQAVLPGSRVTAAMHHLPAKELGELDHDVESDVLICGDDPAARKVTAEIVGAIPGVRVLDVGSLANALPIEAFTAVLLQLNVRYKTRAAIRFTGIPDPE
jgi:NADPH-dependent F420 reductase